MVRLAGIASVAALVSACAGAVVELGQTENPVARPADAVQCGETHWRRARTVAPNFPTGVLMFDHLRDKENEPDPREIVLSFDIDPSGQPVNLRNAGPEWHAEHGAMQSLLSAAAAAVRQWRYERDGPGAPVFAKDCLAAFEYSYRR